MTAPRIFLTVLLLSLAFAPAAQAHRWSKASGAADANHAVWLECPGSNAYSCSTRKEMSYYLYACGDHSWCWYVGLTHCERVHWYSFSCSWRGSEGRSAHGVLVWHREF
jgi:hypothetical protein